MRVAALVPATSWDDDLFTALDSILSQELAPGCELEVLVATPVPPPAVLEDRVRWVPNPTGSIPEGLNRAFGASHSEVIVRVDSRSDLPPGYFTRVVEALGVASTGSVGGAALVTDRDRFGRVYAVAFNSPLLGPSQYRYSATSGPSASPYLGAWRRAVLEEVGGWDGRLLRNQDNELAARVSGAGYEVLYEADLVVGYRAGRGFVGSVKHHHSFGLWRSRQSAMGQQGSDRRHLVAVTLIGTGMLAVGLGLWSKRRRKAVGGLCAIGYIAAVIGSLGTARRLADRRPDLRLDRLRLVDAMSAPALAAVLDVAWLAGVLRGRLEEWPPSHLSVRRPGGPDG